MAEILPRDSVILTTISELSPASSIEDTDVIVINREGTTLKGNIGQIKEGFATSEDIESVKNLSINSGILLNSHLTQSWAVDGTNPGTLSTSTDIPDLQSGQSFSLTHNGTLGATDTNLTFISIPANSFEANKPLTFSVWVKGSVSGLKIFPVLKKLGPVDFGTFPTNSQTISTNWERYSFTFTPTDTFPNCRFEIRVGDNSVAGTFLFFAPKLEKGVVQTPTMHDFVNVSSTQTITGAKTFTNSLTMGSGTTIDARIVKSYTNGANHALAAVCQSTSPNISAANFASTNDFSAVQITGEELSWGTLKISHKKPVGADGNDAGAAALSIDLKANGNGQTAAQGIYINATEGATVGNLLSLRNYNVQHLRLTGDGRLGLGTGFSTPGAKLDVKSDNDTFPSLSLSANSTTSSADLFQAKRASDGAVRTRIDSSGQFVTQNIAFFNSAGIQLGSSSVGFGGGSGVLGITNATTAPTTNPTNGGVLFSQAGSLKWLGSSGSTLDISQAANGIFTNLSVRGTAGTTRDLSFQTGTSDRWRWRVNSDAEAGSDAGSTLQLNACSDAGSFIDNPLTITRAANGNITLNRPTVISNTTASTNTTTGALRISGGLGVAGAINAASLNLTTALSIANGGTGSTSASAARTALGLDPATAQYNASQLQGQTLSSTAPTANQTLVYRSSQWQPRSVIQWLSIGQTATNVAQTLTSSTDVVTALSYTITPKSTASGFKITISINGIFKDLQNTYLKAILKRGSTQIAGITATAGFNQSTSPAGAATASLTFIDYPNTTSSVTYSVWASNGSNAGTIGLQNNNETSTIVVEEFEV